MKTKIAIIAIVSLGAVLVAYFKLYENPLRLSENELEDYILIITPLGSDIDFVQNQVKKSGWRVSYVSEEHGFPAKLGAQKYVGDQSIRAFLGSYQSIPFQVDVTFFWGFDKKGELIDVRAWKTVNGF